jgi:CheY-like chemotaxis protein
MSTQSEFFQQVRDALKHLYDYRYLEDHPLALQYWPETGRAGGPSRAQRLSRLLLESIEELHPPSEPSKYTPRARGYHLLVYRYVEEWPLPDIMRELGYSQRQFFREQRKAIATLAALLREKLPQQVTLPTEPGNLLDVEAERVLAQREAVDLAEVVQGVLEVVSSLAEQHGVALERDLGSRLAPIYGSRTLLRQVFLKALSNLITQPGARRVLLKMRCERQRAIVELITESGIPGFRPDAVGDHRVPDMDPVRRLVEMAGGYWQGVEVEPRSCRCSFDLPVESKKVLLVVEDNEAVIRAFRRFMIGYDYQVIGVTTGAEALRVAREVGPNAITLDVLMPTQDGWEILQALKGDPATQHIPVIICSVLEHPELAHSLGAVAYLRKPVAQTDLLAVLDTLSGTS